MWLHSPGNQKAEGSLLFAFFSTLYYLDSTAQPQSTTQRVPFQEASTPTELRTKKEDCPTPSSKPSLWNIQGMLRLQKPSPAPPLPLPPILLWCQSSLKSERLLLFSLIDISLLRAK